MLLLSLSAAEAALIFQDDGVSVTGGTRSLPATGSIQSGSPFASGSGSYINEAAPMGNGAVNIVKYNPASPANSWAALAGTVTIGGTAYVTLNGGFDFFICPNSVEKYVSAWFPRLDISTISGTTGMRLIFNGNTSEALQLHVVTGSASGVGSTAASFTKSDTFSLTLPPTGGTGLGYMRGPFGTPGTVAHMGVTFNTNPATGLITMKVFGVAGTGEIDTSSSIMGQGNLLGMQTFYASAAAIGASPLPTGQWGLDSWTAAGTFNTPVSVDYDMVRLWNSDPGTFPALGALQRQPVAQAIPTLPEGFGLSRGAVAQSDSGIGVSATVTTSPPGITLNWPAASESASVWVGIYRKLPGGATWTYLTSTPNLPATATTWTDTGVVAGTMYEYMVRRQTGSTLNAMNYGFCWAGINVPPKHIRGTVVLMEESGVAASLANEIATLKSDLNGDGWIVREHAVSDVNVDTAGYASAVVNVKSLIKTDYQNDPTVDAVILLGHVPVPYSGDISPDGHGNHTGAWAADTYYGDMTGTWTDSSNYTNSFGSQTWNKNIPGDGKFDQSVLPAPIDLQVGRIDMYNLPVFTQAGETAGAAEVRLLKQYLNRNHQWRQAQFTVPRRAAVGDGFNVASGTFTLPVGILRAASANVGVANVSAFMNTQTGVASLQSQLLASQDFLWAGGGGYGAFNDCLGIANSTVLAQLGCRAVFTMACGSGFGDWDSPNNLLRSFLAASGRTLGSCYNLPNCFMHPMGMGGTLGEGMRLSQTNGITHVQTAAGLAQTDESQHTYILNGIPTNPTTQFGLMGDPTLRQDMVAPPTALTTGGIGNATLSWTASADSAAPGFQGYYIYRGTAPNTVLTLLNNGNLVTGTNWTDPAPLGNAVYMVRASRLFTANTGTYVNLSQGANVVKGPGLLSVVSRRNQGGIIYDISAPLIDPSGVECRYGGVNGLYQVVLTFDQNIASGSALVTVGTGAVNSIAISGATMTVNLTGVASQQTLTVTASNVTNPSGAVLANAAVKLRILQGDVSGDGVVNAADLTWIRNSYGKLAGDAGFDPRADLNGDGAVNAADITTIRDNYGRQVP